MSYYLEINYEPDEDNMSKIWEPQSIEVYIFWADAIINEAQDKLNNWESISILVQNYQNKEKYLYLELFGNLDKMSHNYSA